MQEQVQEQLKEVVHEEVRSLEGSDFNGEQGETEDEEASLPLHARRLRLLMSMIRSSNDLSTRGLSVALGRCPSRVTPKVEFANVDIANRMARLIDWSVDDVASFLVDGDSGCPMRLGRLGRPLDVGHALGMKMQVNDEDTVLACHCGSACERPTPSCLIDANDICGATAAAMRLLVHADDPEAAADAHYQAGLVLHAEGSPADAVRHYQCALRGRGLTRSARLQMDVNLAAAYGSLDQDATAIGMAERLIRMLSTVDGKGIGDRVLRSCLAFAYFVRGNQFRRRIRRGRADRHAWAGAPRDLGTAQRMYQELASSFGASKYGGMAQTCAAARKQVLALAGRADVAKTLDDCIARGEPLLVASRGDPMRDACESRGWVNVFGAELALDRVSDPDEVQRYAALFTQRLDAVVGDIGSWELAAHQCSIEYTDRLSRECAGGSGFEDVLLDASDRARLVGVVGRYPCMRDSAMALLMGSAWMD